eukprot:3349729-Rhodomonas_salina.1
MSWSQPKSITDLSQAQKICKSAADLPDHDIRIRSQQSEQQTDTSQTLGHSCLCLGQVRHLNLIQYCSGAFSHKGCRKGKMLRLRQRWYCQNCLRLSRQLKYCVTNWRVWLKQRGMKVGLFRSLRSSRNLWHRSHQRLDWLTLTPQASEA